MNLMLMATMAWVFLDRNWEIGHWENAVASKGTVTGFTNDSRPPAVHYVYRDRDGVEHSGSTPRGFVPEDSKQGDEIDLFYLRLEPGKSRLISPDQDIIGFSLMEIAVVSVGMVVLFWVLAAFIYCGVMPSIVNRRLVLVGKNELAEDYFFR